MRKIPFIATLAVAIVAIASLQAAAHTIWVTGEDVKAGQNATIVRGYSDVFAVVAEIAEARLSFLPAPTLKGPDGKDIALTSGSDTSHFQTSAPLAKGTYLVVGQYVPTYWTQTSENGWEMKGKDEVSGTVVDSYRFAMGAKGVLNVDGALDTELITKPIGQTLEIVPVTNPQAAKVNDVIEFQILLQGKPLPGALVTAMLDGYGDDHELKAFSNLADDKGVVKFIPWKSGFWQLEVLHTLPPSEPNKGNKEDWGGALSFFIN